MLRINEIVRKEEEKSKSKLKLDKDSSARIIKRSLWQLAQKTDDETEPKIKSLKLSD